MICGAVGGECPYNGNEKNEWPCDKCEVGREFRKKWQNEPVIHDDN